MYRNLKTNHKIIRTVGYALPAVLHAHIQTVAPTTHFPSMQGRQQTPRRRSSGAAPAQADAASGKVVREEDEPGNMASFLRWLYKSESYSYDRDYGDYDNRLGILGIDDEYPSQTDLTSFMAEYRLEGIFARFHVEQVNRGNYDPQDPSDGASVTVQYASAMAFPEFVVFYSDGGNTVWTENGGEPIAGDMWLEWLAYLHEELSPPPTILIGYGEPERGLPAGYARVICDSFAQLGVKGVTILVASGWNGVGEQGNCYNSVGRRSFVPEFPASCTCGVL